MQTKVKIRVAFFAYGGNSGFPSVICSHLPLMVELTRLLDNHPCVGASNWDHITYSDTPVTMTRNRAACDAKQDGYDFVMMIDSDNVIDLYKKIEGLKGFLASALDFSIPRLMKGLPTVIAAPYCGQPPDPISGGRENIFAFHWELKEHDNAGGSFSLEQYSIQHAAIMAGIQPAGAAATGVILYSTNAFDLLEPPYFKYEWTTKYQTHKASTEDVQNTRDISMASIEKYGENCLFIDWDNWAGHVKPKIVGKPHPTPVEAICPSFRKAVLENHHGGERMHHVNFETPKPKPKFDPTIPNQVAAAIEAAANPERMSDEELVRQMQKLTPSPKPDIQPFAEINGRPLFKTRREAEAYRDQLFTKEQIAEAEQEAKQVLHGAPVENSATKPFVGTEIIADQPVTTMGFASNIADMEALTKAVRGIEKHLGRHVRCAEIGSWCGSSAIALCAGFSHPESKLFCIDTWAGSPSDQTSAWVLHGANPRELFDQNTKHLQDIEQVIPVSGESSAVAASRPHSEELDLIFIDAGHTRSELERDIDSWWHHLQPDGVMMFHDYNDPGHPAVTEVLNERFGEHLKVFPDTHVALVAKADVEESKHEPEAIVRELPPSLAAV